MSLWAECWGFININNISSHILTPWTFTETLPLPLQLTGTVHSFIATTWWTRQTSGHIGDDNIQHGHVTRTRRGRGETRVSLEKLLLGRPTAFRLFHSSVELLSSSSCLNEGHSDSSVWEGTHVYTTSPVVVSLLNVQLLTDTWAPFIKAVSELCNYRLPRSSDKAGGK